MAVDRSLPGPMASEPLDSEAVPEVYEAGGRGFGGLGFRDNGK